MSKLPSFLRTALLMTPASMLIAFWTMEVINVFQAVGILLLAFGAGYLDRKYDES